MKPIFTRINRKGKKRYTVLSKEEGYLVEVGIFRYWWLSIRNRIPINRIKGTIINKFKELIWKL